MKQQGWPLLFKRTLDVLVGGGALVASTPILGALAALIRVSMGKPVLFAQERPGHRGRIFTTYKLRTMRDAVDARGRPLPDHERLTTLGQLIRRSSLDELPQLWNVVRGEMSLVGPRPLLVRYLDRYSPEQARRHDVLPGITGWAQINGRNATTWDQRFAHDLWYVDNWSPLLDVRILVATLTKVVRADGVSQPGHETMREFMGSERD